MNRRAILSSALFLACAPAIVKAASLMPIKAYDPLKRFMFSTDFGYLVDYRIGTIADFLPSGAYEPDLFAGMSMALVRADDESRRSGSLKFVCSRDIREMMDYQAARDINVLLSRPVTKVELTTTFRSVPIEVRG